MDGKRLFDIAVSLIVLTAALPILLPAALSLKLASPGPVLFRAKRVGKNGDLFTMHKLRTMRVHDQQGGPVITGPNDPRIFAIGDFLRKTKIDELPQFFDVLRGKMSVVGPRPEDPQIVDQYYTDRHKETLKVKPGITSPAAIDYSTRSNSQLENEDVVGSYVKNVLDPKLEIELDYIGKAGLTEDLKIVLRTAGFVLSAMWNFGRNLSFGSKLKL